MSNGRDPADFLNKLREDLKHFDESGHLVDDPNVTEIRSILVRRIAEIEAAFQRIAEIAAATLEQGSGNPTDDKQSLPDDPISSWIPYLSPCYARGAHFVGHRPRGSGGGPRAHQPVGLGERRAGHAAIDPRCRWPRSPKLGTVTPCSLRASES
jgi:hypothetical protein